MEDLFKVIEKYRKSKKVVFFVGAGVSAVSNYPSWGELVKGMADDLKYAYKVDDQGKAIFSTEEYLRIPQIYFDNRRNKKYLEKVKAAFENTCKPNKVHDLIMQLEPYHILTTNYDTLLEQAADKYGINYSIINADNKVAQTSSLRYIVKVHGDFTMNNFVLKEQDYLDYEQNFILIDNLMKTIVATNLIIFIGYSLSDYNIKLILNWVKQVQKDTFIEPIFIYTGEKSLNRKMFTYYKKRGLRILDTNKIIKKGTYEEKYICVLKKIKDYREDEKFKNELAAIDYLYNLLKELDVLSYIRTRDINTLFKKKYYIDPQRCIVNNTKEESYIESYYRLLGKKENLPEEYKVKIETISSVMKKSNINGIHYDSIYNGLEDIKIENKIFYSKYDEVEKLVNISEYSAYKIKELYDIAYYLYSTGRFQESYKLYTDILKVAKEENEWFYYYLCQINRMFVYQTIIFLWKYFRGNGIIVYGPIKLFDERFIEEIISEMSNFQFEELFYSLPAEIRAKYSFLKRLCTNNIYSKEIIEIFESIYEINQKIFLKNVTLVGQSEFEKAKDILLDTICFTYNNHLLYAQFSEHKHFVRNTLINCYKAESERMKIRIENNEIFANKKFELNLQDFILVYKNFKWKDILYLENEIEFSNFEILDKQEIENFIKQEIEYYNSNYCSTILGDKLRMYFLYKDEYLTLSYLSLYFIVSREVLYIMLDYILNSIPDREMDVDKKYNLLYKYIGKFDIDCNIEKIIEEYLLEKFEQYVNSYNAFGFQEWERNIYKKYLNLLVDFNDSFISNKISAFCKEDLPDYLKKYLLEFKQILTHEAVGRLETK